MFTKWKNKLKASIQEAKDKRSAKQNKHDSAETLAQPVVAAADKQNDGLLLSRPHGLVGLGGGRRSMDSNSMTQQQQQQDPPAGRSAPTGRTSLEFAVPPPAAAAAAAHGAGASSSSYNQQQHDHTQLGGQPGPQQQQQQQPTGPLRPIECADRSAQGVDTLMESLPASPTSAQHNAGAGGLQDGSSARAHASSAGGGAPGSAPGGHTSAAAAAQAPAAADGTDHAGSTLAGGSAAGGQHRLDVSRTPKDYELGTCPPYAAKAVWGLRYAMEDKWAAVPNLIQLPLLLTCAPKKSKGGKAPSGCGCMIPAASKVLAKVSPSSRLSSSNSAGAKADATKPSLSTQSPSSPGLDKPSPDRQRLISQGVSSDDQQQQQQPSQHPEGAAAAGAGAPDGGADAAAAGSLGPQPGMDALHYFGVFDGHGGVDAARHCAQRMHQVVCGTILSMLHPEVASAAVVSSLATSSRQPAENAGQPQPQDEQQPAAAANNNNGSNATAADASSAPSAAATTSSNTAAAAAAAAAAAQQPMPAIDVAASNGSWLLPALSRSFVSLDHEFGAISEGSYVGSTAVVVLVGSSRMWVAHCGDSRAILGRGGAVQVLTSDHKASRDDEVARVQAAGGHVWWDRVMGELAVSRAIGDHCLRPYVIPEPELLMVERSGEDEVLVMASDGLWDVMNNQEAVDMALHSLQAAHASGHAGVAAVKRSANALTKAALERGTRDNVTVLVVDMRPRKPGSYEAAVSTTSSSSHHHTSSSSRHSSSRGHSSSGKASSSASSSRTASSSTSKKVAVAAGTGAAAAAGSAATSGAASPAALSAEANAVAMPATTSSSSNAVVTPAPAPEAAAAPAAAPAAPGVDALNRTESDSETRALMQQQHHTSASGGGI